MKNTIKAVALAIYVLIKNRKSHLSNGIVDESDEEMQKHLEIFDEKLHPLTVRTNSIMWKLLFSTEYMHMTVKEYVF